MCSSAAFGLCLLCVSLHAAYATPPIEGEGPLDLRLEPSANTLPLLTTKAAKLGQPLAFETSFRVPTNPKGIIVELRLEPLDVTMQLNSGGPLQTDDSGIERGAWSVSYDLTQLVAGNRVTLPVTLIPHAARGGGLKVFLRCTAGIRCTGHAARILAADTDGAVYLTSFPALARLQLEALHKDTQEQRDVLTADTVLLFDPDQFPDAMKQDSERAGFFKEAP